MRSVLAAAAFFTAFAFSPPAVKAEVITIGHSTFDFDAPSSPLTAGQQAFFQKYKDAVNRHDKAALMTLQDDSMKSCAVVSPASRSLQGFGKTIPDDAKVRFFDATDDIAKEMGFGDMAYLSTQPTAVLGVISRTKSEREIKIATILAPVRQIGESFAFVPYCLTDKGKALLEQKSRTQP